MPVRNVRISGKIQADFEAVIMKTAAPIKRLGGLKIVPFNADAAPAEITVHLAPGPTNAMPELRL